MGINHILLIVNNIISMQPDINQTFVSIQQTEIITVTANSAKHSLHRQEVIKCKICHGATTEDKPMQCFCSCKDKQSYTHASCLQAYLQKKLNKSLDIDLDPQQATLCEKCEQSYKVEYVIVRKCTQLPRFKKAIQRKSFLFGICVIGLILSIITVGVCSSILKRINYSETTAMPRDEREIVICFIIFATLLLILFSYKIVEKFLTFRQASVAL